MHSRHILLIVYGIWFAMFVYCVHGAATDNLIVPGASTLVRVWGSAAWLACLVPLLLAAETYVRLDPHVALGKKARWALSAVLLVATVGVIFAVFRLGVV